MLTATTFSEKKPIQSGIFKDIPIATYHAQTALTASKLKKFSQCPLKFWYQYLSGDYVEKETPALIFGQALHTIILEPDRFENDYIVTPSFDRRTKKGKEEAALFAQSNGHKILLSPDDFKKLHGMKSAIFQNDKIVKILKDAQKEHTFIQEFLDQNARNEGKKPIDLKMMCRPDFIANNFVFDIKTTQDASRHAFIRSVYKYQYHLQGAFYLDLLNDLTHENYSTMVFLAIEKEPPYASAIYFLSHEMIEKGRVAYMEAIEQYRECVRTNIWPSYNNNEIEALE